MRPECNGLDLASFLLEPVQRLTRYPMLLKQILKYSDQSSEEGTLLAVAIDESQHLLDRVNQSMLEGEEQEKLLQLQRRISGQYRRPSIKLKNESSHSVVLPANLAGLTRSFGERKLIKSGIWIKQRSGRKLLTFLFSDFILLTEAQNVDTTIEILDDESVNLKVYRKAIHLDDIWSLQESESTSAEHRTLLLEAHEQASPLLVQIASDEYEDWIELISSSKRSLKISVPKPNVGADTQIGILKITILSADNLSPSSAYVITASTPKYCVFLSFHN